MKCRKCGSRLEPRHLKPKHKLLCGDSTNPKDVDRLMDGQKAHMVFTDPPYAIYGSSTGVSSDVADDKMVRPFFRDILRCAKHHSRKFAHIYICCDFRSWSSWWEVSKDVGLQVKNCIVWDKQSPGMGSMYQNRHEFLLFATNSQQETVHISRKNRATGQRLVEGISNLWSIPRMPSKEKEHNAAKPTELVMRAARSSSDEKDSILDPFLGSGTTLIAAQQLGRRCFGLEIEPKFVDISIRRWENLTGEKARLDRANGPTMATIRKRRKVPA